MKFKSYLREHARKLDFCLYQHLFEGADSAAVLTELSAYQNSDGGFGKALESDLRLPDSSALATTVAFQYLSQIKVGSDNPVVANALNYLVTTFDKSRAGWVNIPPSADQYPRAPWWNFASATASVEWGNPSAEALGYMLAYSGETPSTPFIQRLTRRALQRLHEIDNPEPHEIRCYVRLYEYANKDLRQSLHDLLAGHIKKSANTDPKEWHGYVSTPLTFIDSPDSPFADLFSESLIMENLSHLQSQLVDGDHWEPTWSWGQFEDEWAKAKTEWSGKLTVDNLKTLRAFGIEQPI